MNPSSPENKNPKSPFRDMFARTKTEKKGWSFFGGLTRLVLLAFFGAMAGAAGIAAQGYIFFTQGLPSIEKLRNYSPPIVTRMYGSKGELLIDFAAERRFVVSLDQIPKTVQNAFVAAEDKNFWRHRGIDTEAIIRAAKNYIVQGGGGGASTITQQVARAFLLTPEKKFIRKIKEQILATRIEQAFSKEHILYLYLNQIYLGSSAHGVQAAAETYFGKDLKDLTIDECAMLAGLPQRPSDYSPKINLKAALARRGYALKRMLDDGYITEDQYEQASKVEPQIATPRNTYASVAPDFVEHVRRYISSKYGAEALMKDGLQIYTTVDIEMTKAAREAMERGLGEVDKRQGYRGPIRTLTAKSVKEFLEEKTQRMDEPLRFGDVTEGVVTHIDSENIYVRMGSYVKDGDNRDYVGQIKIDPNPKWWVRTPYVRSDLRTRNFSPGDLPFQVGDLILVRLIDPNIKRRELYMQKYGKTDPEMKNYKKYTEDMLSYFPLEPEQEPSAQSALMMRENRTGFVRVMLGGYSSSRSTKDQARSEYNRAIQSRRLAGSSFKPAIYAAALNKGFTPADILLDSPITLTVPGTNETWTPKNYRGGYLGPISFRDAIVKSRNIPTIKILQQIGIEYAKSYARKLGYVSPLAENLTMALGSSGVSLEEQLTAYSVFPNRGYLVPNLYITRIVDRNGKILEEHDPPALLDDPVKPDQPEIQKVSLDTIPRRTGAAESSSGIPARRVVDDGTAYIMSTMLQGVVQDGTATILKKIVGRPDIAGKTGTTNEYVDAWFMGFSPDYTCGVWVGFDSEISLGDQETGGKAAAPIWGYFMKSILRDKPVKEYPIPSSVEYRRVDPRTGLPTSGPNGLQEVFKVGSSPTAAGPKIMKGSELDYSGSDLDQF